MTIQNVKHAGLSAWIKEVAELTQPDDIYISVMALTKSGRGLPVN